MNYIKNKIIKNSELARQLGVSATLFYYKLHRQNYNKFSEEEIKQLKKIIEDFISEFRSEI
jgi:hypothetical protein